MKLYEINQHYLDVLENGFSFDEETGEILFDKENLDQLEGAFEEKVDNIACYIKDLEGLKSAIDQEAKSLAERKKQTQTKIDNLKQYLLDSLTMRDLNKYETPRNKLSTRKSTSVKVTNENLIKAEYFTEKVERKLDKKTLLKDLKDGAEIEGAELQVKQNLQLK